MPHVQSSGTRGADARDGSGASGWFVGAFRCCFDHQNAQIGPVADSKGRARSGEIRNSQRNDWATGHCIAWTVLGVACSAWVHALALVVMIMRMLIVPRSMVTRAMHFGDAIKMSGATVKLCIRFARQPKQNTGQDDCRHRKNANDVPHQVHQRNLIQFPSFTRKRICRCVARNLSQSRQRNFQSYSKATVHFLIRKS